MCAEDNDCCESVESKLGETLHVNELGEMEKEKKKLLGSWLLCAESTTSEDEGEYLLFLLELFRDGALIRQVTVCPIHLVWVCG